MENPVAIVKSGEEVALIFGRAFGAVVEKSPSIAARVEELAKSSPVFKSKLKIILGLGSAAAATGAAVIAKVFGGEKEGVPVPTEEQLRESMIRHGVDPNMPADKVTGQQWRAIFSDFKGYDNADADAFFNAVQAAAADPSVGMPAIQGPDSTYTSPRPRGFADPSAGSAAGTGWAQEAPGNGPDTSAFTAQLTQARTVIQAGVNASGLTADGFVRLVLAIEAARSLPPDVLIAVAGL